jgi:hypothetical protein
MMILKHSGINMQTPTVNGVMKNYQKVKNRRQFTIKRWKNMGTLQDQRIDAEIKEINKVAKRKAKRQTRWDTTTEKWIYK